MIALVLLLAWHELWQSMTRATSSGAATARGIAQYAKAKYADATHAFGDANAIRHSPQTAFNLGTSQVAAGQREDGSAMLTQAMRDPALRADAFYNRGSSALSANSYDAAIRDFTETLRLRPDDLQAKRNLEIALRHKAMQQSPGGKNNRSGSQPKPQPSKQPAPAPGDQRANKPQGEMDAEALLRAVQQQEREELMRMRRGKAEPERIGW